MDDKQFDKINKKLDALIKVAGMAACRELSPDEQAWLLHCAGLSSPEIADMLGSTDIAIRQAIHRMKTRSKSKRSKRGGPSEAAKTSK
jgi:DNA-directed RNA polymerase specialized sigma24 family protein